MKLSHALTKKKMFVYRGGDLMPCLKFIRHGQGFIGYTHRFKNFDETLEWCATAGKAFMTPLQKD